MGKKVIHYTNICIVLIFVLLIIGCEDINGGNKKTISHKLVGKWETTTIIYQGVTYTLPCNFMGVNIENAGIVFTPNSMTSYTNGIVRGKIEDVYTEGNSIFYYGGISGISWKINGNTLSIKAMTLEEDIYRKVNKFSWE